MNAKETERSIIEQVYNISADAQKYEQLVNAIGYEIERLEKSGESKNAERLEWILGRVE